MKKSLGFETASTAPDTENGDKPEGRFNEIDRTAQSATVDISLALGTPSKNHLSHRENNLPPEPGLLKIQACGWTR